MLPTLVVGLGGTGSWALAYLKRRLLVDSHWQKLAEGPSVIAREDYDRNPWPVELKAIDVDRKRRPSLGALKLEGQVEDILLTAPVGSTITDIASGRSGYTTIETWLPPNEAKEHYNINEASKFMTEGLGQIRQFGRVAFFFQQINGAQELRKLDDAFARLTHGDDVQVFVVSSVAGGTGAGLLIDTLGYLSTQRSKMAGQVSVRATGFIVLPGGFAGALKADKFDLAQANGMATLRELDRMLNAHETVEFEWRPGLRERLAQAALDFCYLVDGSREQSAGPQLDRFEPVEQALPAAIGDAIYAHVFPSSGAILGRDYANYTAALIGGAENRYFSFGSCVIAYDWERLMGSLSLHALGEVLAAIRAPAADFGRQQVTGFLSTGATGPLAVGEEQQAVPALAASGLSSIPDPQDLEVPGPGWLTPSEPDQTANVPNTPQLLDRFPGIGRMRTEYQNPTVVSEAESIVGDFFGPSTALWSGNSEPRFYEAINYNADRSSKEWRRALMLASAAIMNSNGRVGGPSAAREFLLSIELKLEQLGTNLSRAAQPDLTSYKLAVQQAEEEMHDGRRWDDWKEQKDYLAARQDLLEEEVHLACYQRTSELIGRFASTTTEVKEHVAGWDLDLEKHQGLAVEERRRIDDDRHKADEAPLQRFVPQPGEPLERQLFAEHWGVQPDGRAATGLQDMLANLQWHVSERPAEPLMIVLRHPTFTSQGRYLQIADLKAACMQPFLPLRTLSIMEVLERASVDADDLASEIRRTMAALATYDPGRQYQVTGGENFSTSVDHLFAYWPSEQDDSHQASQPGAALSARLRTLMGDMGISVQDLTAEAREKGYPVQDKIIGYSVRALVAQEAFTGVQALETAYNLKRDYKPPTHLLPEERGAAELELLSEQLVRDGLMSEPLGKLRADDVGYCSDQQFLLYVASALSKGAVSFEQPDRLDESTGRWLVTAEDGSRLELGSSADLGTVLGALNAPATATLERVRQEIRTAGAIAPDDNGAKDRLAQFAREPWTRPGRLGGALHRILQTAAADGARRL